MTDISNETDRTLSFLHINRMRNASIQLNAEIIYAVVFLIHTQNASGIYTYRNKVIRSQIIKLRKNR